MHGERPVEAEQRGVAELLGAYARGAFPMADPDSGRIEWFCPDPRAVIDLAPGGFHIPRSLARTLRRDPFLITTDAAFESVIAACAAPNPQFPERDASWIDERFIHAYTALHRAGHAHSVEAWHEEPGGPSRLVGGIYGVHLGSAFFAESKFCRPDLGGTDASKVCLAYLVAHLRQRGFELLDVQFPNPHLEQFGVRLVPRRRFLEVLGRAAERPTAWTPFEPRPLGEGRNSAA